jgi:hypothetical protein
VSAPTANDFATVASYFDTGQRSFVTLNGTYQVSFKAKGTSGSKSILVTFQRFGGANFLYQTIKLTNDWAVYTLPFVASEVSTGFAPGALGLKFNTVDADGFLLDDVSLTQTNSDPANPTAFRDAVVNTLKTLNPGVLRFWAGQLGDTVDNLIAPVYGRQRAGYSAFATEWDDISYGLPEFLQLCETVGADPWVVVPSTIGTAEAANLIEYLAGATSTKYGAIRAAAGHPVAWTSSFNKIHLEFGNEAWNGVFKGGSIEYSAPYGQRAQAIFGAMRAHSAYVASAFDLVLGGQAAWPARNTDIQNNCNNNDSFAVAPYMMNTVNSFSSDEALYGSTFAEPEAFVSASGTAEGVSSGLMLQVQQAIQASSHPVPVSVYETNLSTLSGMTQTALNSYTSSIGAGLAVVDGMLQQMRQGVLVQNLFALPQYQFLRPDGTLAYLWGAVVDMGVTNLKRPQFLALQLANQAIGSNTTMLATTHSGSNPSWDQALANTVQLNGAHYLQSFAFGGSTQPAVVIFNLHRTASLPVTFSGINAPTGSVQLQQLTSAKLSDNNENGPVVNITTQTLSGFNSSTSLNLPPFSMTVLSWSGSVAPSQGPLISAVAATSITSTSATITWTTSQASTSQVQYGTTLGLGSSSALNSAPVTSHSVTLSGLAPGTAYKYSVVSAASTGTTASPIFTFTTASGAPVISGISASSITGNSATIAWTTDQPSTSQVAFGTSTAYGQYSVFSSTMGTTHTTNLTALTPGTTYYFAAVSVNSTGLTTTTPGGSFTTPSNNAPVIKNVTASNITSTSATLTWTTDQASTSQVKYGTTTAYGSFSTFSASLVTNHSVTLTGLVAGTNYNYSVMSTNSAAGSSASANATFSTIGSKSSTGITPVGAAGGNTGTANTPAVLSIGYTSHANNTILVGCAIQGSSGLSAISDSGGSKYSLVGASNANGVRVELWMSTIGGSVASTSFNIRPSGGAPMSCEIGEWSGVVSIAQLTTGTGTQSPAAVSVATRLANDYVVAAIGAGSYNTMIPATGIYWSHGGTTGNSTGNLVSSALMYNSSTVPSALSCSTVFGSQPWAAVGIELRNQ